MKFNTNQLNGLLDFFNSADLLPGNAKKYLEEMNDSSFTFYKQLLAADSIHLHIKVADTAALPHDEIMRHGAEAQNAKDGYIKYAFPNGYNFIFSSIPVSEEERAGLATFSYPHLDHIGIDIRDESAEAYDIYNAIPAIATEHEWPVKKQGGEGKKVYCCHVQVNEKYWVYPQQHVYYEFAFGKLLVSEEVFGCDLRPVDPALGIAQESLACCGADHKEEADTNANIAYAESHYKTADLKKFGSIVSFQKELGEKFFGYYADVFKDSALSAREKSLIALAVAHAVQCPYCIDAYSADSIKKGYNKQQVMEAVHVAAAIRSGATLVHGVQMMNRVNNLLGEEETAVH